jgi:CheY-like chemotaxis protein
MNTKLNLELAKEYFKFAPKASASFYAISAVIIYYLWEKVPVSVLLSWVGINLVGATSFLFAGSLFKRYGSESNANDWLRIYAYLVLFQDVSWGLIGPVSFMVGDEAYRLLTLFMLGGMAAGAITTRALVFKIYLITLFSLLMPTTITLALQGTVVADGMLALVLIYLVFMLFVAKSYSDSFNRNILRRLDSEKLVKKLRNSHAELEAANPVRTSEIGCRKTIESELAFKRSCQAPVKTCVAHSPGLQPVQWQAFNVLVVDDNEINRMVLTTFLDKTGIPFSEATNGLEAIERIRFGNFDLVLLDIQMPDISGIEVARRLRVAFSSMPVLIAVTAHADPEQHEAMLSAGFSDFLTKPVAISDLLEILTQAYLGRWKECDICENS